MELDKKESHYCPLRSPFDPISVYLLNYQKKVFFLFFFHPGNRQSNQIFQVVLFLSRNKKFSSSQNLSGLLQNSEEVMDDTLHRTLVVLLVPISEILRKESGNILLYCNTCTLSSLSSARMTATYREENYTFL